MFMNTMIILAAILIALLGAIIVIYNNLVALKNSIKKNWANIDVLLKQRNSELPKLIDACKEYMQFESETLNSIVEARSKAMAAQSINDLGSLGNAESQLRLGLNKLFALAENYPDLKTNNSFQQLQTRISGLENDISDRRELYNESVNLNNIRIEQFPDLIIAKMFNFVEFPLLHFSEQETQDVNIKNLFC